MIEVTGYFDGEPRKDFLITPQQALEAFDMELPKEKTYFKVLDGRKSRDSNGKLIAPPTKSLMKKFSGVTKEGHTIQFVFYDRKFTDKNGNVQFHPRKETYIRDTMLVFGDDKIEQKVFLMLHPENAGSPIASENPYFYTWDKEAVNRKIVDAQRKAAMLVTKIATIENEFEVRRLAASLYKEGRPLIPNAGTEELWTVKSSLISLASKDYETVSNAFDGKEAAVRGALGILTDTGVIKSNTSAHGTTFVLGNAIIGKASKAQLPFEALFTNVTSDPELLKVVLSAYNKVAGITEKVIADNNTETDVAKAVYDAVQKGLVGFVDGKTVLLTDGEPVGTLVANADEETWVDDLVALIPNSNITKGKFFKHYNNDVA